MIREKLRARGLLAAIGFLTVVSMLGASVVVAKAIATQEQQEQEGNQESTSSNAIRRAMAAAKEAMVASQERLEREQERRAKREEATVRKLHEQLRRVQEEGASVRQRRLGVQFPGLRSIALRRGMALTHGGMSAEGILAHAEDLGLSGEQVDQIREASNAQRRAAIKRNADVQLAGIDLKDMLADTDTADLDAVEAKMQEIASLKVADRIAVLRLRQQVRGVLSPEQLEQLEDESGHNVFMLRRGGEEPRGWRFRNGEVLDFDFDDLDSIDWAEEFGNVPFGIFEFKSKKDSSESGEDEGEGHESVSRQTNKSSVGIVIL